MFANIKSRQGNKCAQVFATHFGWVFVVPLTTKGDAHDALSIFLRRYGAPPAMIVDGSKEQIGKTFRRKLQEADTHLRQTEPYSPWQQAAEGAIREVKRALARLMIKSGAPKVVFDPSNNAPVPEPPRRLGITMSPWRSFSRGAMRWPGDASLVGNEMLMDNP
jgi:hypothetical protein